MSHTFNGIEKAFVSPMENANKLLNDLANYCMEQNISLEVRLGDVPENEAPAPVAEATWQRESLRHIFAQINERICVIAGCEPDTMDRRLHEQLMELAEVLTSK